MATKTVTPANVLASALAVKSTGLAVTDISAGTLVYLDPSTNLWNIAGAGDAVEAAGIVNGVSALGYTLNSTAAAGQPITVLLQDDNLAHGVSGVAAGDILVLSPDGDGTLADLSDLGPGHYVHIAMIAKSATHAVFRPVAGPNPIPSE